MQRGCGGRGKSTELYEVKQHAQEKKEQPEIVSVANKSAEESGTLSQSLFSTLTAVGDEVGKCTEEKD